MSDRKPARLLHIRRLLLLAGLPLAISLHCPLRATAQQFTFTNLYGPPRLSLDGVVATGINNSNIVVGYYQTDSDQRFHGFSYQNGIYTPIDGPIAGESTAALAINNNGDILISQGSSIGSFFFAPSTYFIYSAGTFSPIGLKGVFSATGSAFTFASITGLNNSRQIVARYAGHGIYGVPAIGPAGSTTPPTSNGNFTQFDCPAGDGPLSSTGTINDSGQITGTCEGGTLTGATVYFQGFIYTAGHFSFYLYPASFVLGEELYSSQGFGINNAGAVAGYFQNSGGGEFSGFLYDGSTYSLVVPPEAGGAKGTSYALGLNDSGTVVGYYQSALSDSSIIGFVAIPSLTNRSGKVLGSCGCDGKPGQPTRGDPITVSTGNLFEQAEDYTTSGQNPLTVERFYNSDENTAPVSPLASSLGVNWRSTYDRYLNISSANSVTAERADGQQLTFTLNGGVWTSDSDIDVSLTNAGGTWTLTDHDDTVETYADISATEAHLQTIKSRNGYTQTLSYGASNQLAAVTDSYGRALSFSYNASALLQTVTTPDATTVTYGYAASGASHVLTSVSYSTAPASTVTYLYGDATLPFALTGIIDENNNRYATWTYDSAGRALSSELGAGANLTTITYNNDGSRTVTNALGVQDTYKFTTLQGVPKITEIDRAATATTAAATELFTYDSNGFTASQTDWDGNQTTYVNDAHGDPTAVDEAVGTVVTRTTTVIYDPTWVHLPKQIVTPGITANFTYDASGELLTRTLTDTTTTTVPYSTQGQTRTWTNSWGNFLLASSKSPNGNTASFAYDASGALTGTTNALGQTTTITAHTGGGLPETVVDANGVTTTLTYDARQRLLTASIHTSTGLLTTTSSYDAAGNLTKTTLPDGSALTNTYDTAHRLTEITDLFHQNVAYTLDPLGDRIKTNLTAVGNRIQRLHSDNFDALGRASEDIGGVGQTTAFTYDPNGNALTITNPLGRVATRTFDALNRLSKVVDPNSGTTLTSYDAHDRIVSVTDPNGNVTSYVFDGFGDVIQQLSPDSGKTIYHYDNDSNLTSKTDARGIITNNTFDALNRILTTTYPSDPSENVAYKYDEAGHGFGIGRLTSLTDAAGMLSRSYDERGNRLSETRVNGPSTLTTIYTYDAANRIASMTYPSGWKAAYTRDIMGRVWQIPLTTPGGVAAGNAITNATYKPFGPLYTLTFGNGVNEARAFDLDYRVTNLADSGSVALQNLTYGYDANDNVSSLADGVTPANSQVFGYDLLDRLTSATGAYGAFGWTYDRLGNRLTQTLGAAITSYAYSAGTNRLGSITAGGVTTPVGYVASGNISSIPPTTGAPVATITYNAAGRLKTVTGTALAITGTLYDAFGQRFSKTSGGSPTIFTYGEDSELAEESQGGAATDYVYLNGRPVATITANAGKVYFLHADRLGTPQLATDDGQAVVWSAKYQPFGDTGHSVVGTITQNLRFPGQYFDAETEMNYNLNRQYMTDTGRYLESDPIGINGGINPYLYAGAEPLKSTDRTGLCCGNVTDYNADRVFGIGSANQGPGLFDALGKITGFLGDAMSLIGSEVPLLSKADVGANAGSFINDPLSNGLPFAQSIIGYLCPQAARGIAIEHVIGFYLGELIEGPDHLSPEEINQAVRFGVKMLNEDPPSKMRD